MLLTGHTNVSIKQLDYRSAKSIPIIVASCLVHTKPKNDGVFLRKKYKELSAKMYKRYFF